MMKSVMVLPLVLELALSGVAQQPTSPPKKPSPIEQQPLATPQQPARPRDEDVVRISTNLVQVDAVVTDKNGKQVIDLRPEELEILEDGRPQKITNFSYISLDSTESPLPAERAKPVDKNAPPVPPVRLRPEQIRRTMALVVDDLGLSFESAYYVRQALKKFLDQQMQPADLVAIIRTGGGMGALQQFTSDKRQLYAAVEKVKWNPMGRGGIGAFGLIENDPLRSIERNWSEVGVRSQQPDNGSQQSDTFAELDQFREEVFTVGTLGALNYVVRGLRELPGRKSVLLISDGIKIFNTSDPQRNTRVEAALNTLIDLANRASVVVYTMDARGLQTLGLTAADNTTSLRPDQIQQSLAQRRSDLWESQNGLNYLAQQTGGLAIRSTNDLNGGIKRVVDDQKGYYLIGYRPDESTFDLVSGRRKFLKLAIKVSRQGKFNVRMRNGFYGITDEEAVPTRKTAQQHLISALTSPFGSAGVQLRLTSLFANDPKLGSIMRSFVHVKGRDLTFTDEADGWHKVVFDIIAVTFGDNGNVVDEFSRTNTVRVRGRSYEHVLNDGFSYNLTVPVKKAGAYQLRTALRDVISERVGSASQFIEVPDMKKNRLTVSGILLKGMPSGSYQKGATAVSSQQANSDDAAEEDPKGDVAVRQFQVGYVVEYAFFIYNAQLAKATGKPQLQTQVRMFRNGQQIFAGKEIPFDATNQHDLKRLAQGGAIVLGSEMTHGEYVFQIVVTDTLAKEQHRVATQWIDFEIAK
jgi:VWFA-related protein